MKIFEVEQPTNKFNPELRQRLRGRSNFPLSTSGKDQEFGGGDALDMSPTQQQKNTSANSKTTKSTTRFATGNPKIEKFFDEFDSQAKPKIQRLGLTPVYVHDSEGKFYVLIMTKNNVPVKVGTAKNEVVWVSGLNKEVQKAAIYAAAKENGIDTTPPRNDGWAGFTVAGKSKINLLPEVLGMIDGLGADFKQQGSNRKPRSKSARDYYEFLARNIVNAWASGQSYAFARGGPGEAYDQYDNLITIGYTKEGYRIANSESGKDIDAKKSGTWREHVVPGDYINKMCIDICERNIGTKKKRIDRIEPSILNKTIYELADIINRNLAIVIASREEARYIDSVMGWQTTMPPGWRDGDNILARFIQCKGYPDADSVGIPVYSVSGGKRIAENNNQ